MTTAQQFRYGNGVFSEKKALKATNLIKSLVGIGSARIGTKIGINTIFFQILNASYMSIDRIIEVSWKCFEKSAP